MDWYLYGNGLRHERVNRKLHFLCSVMIKRLIFDITLSHCLESLRLDGLQNYKRDVLHSLNTSRSRRKKYVKIL